MSGWQTRRIGEIAESVDYGVTASAIQQPIGPKFLRITDIQNGSVSWQTVPWCDCDARSASHARLKSGDIVFARTGATTGKSFLIGDCPTDAVFASYLIRLRLSDCAEPDFVSHYFQTPDYWAQIAKSARGAAQAGVNATTLKSIEIPLPPMTEQRRIAAILDKADALRAKRRMAIVQLDTLTQSIFLDMFGDPVLNRAKWTRVQLADICASQDDIKCGPFGTQLAKDEYRREGIPLWGIKHVNAQFQIMTDEFLDPAKAKELGRYSIQVDDIVITRKGTVGNCAIYPHRFPDGIMHSDLLRVRVRREKTEPHFLAHQLHHSRDVERQVMLISSGAVMLGINVTRLKSLQVLDPPIELQREFARRIAAVERLMAVHSASLAKIDRLFASLQHRAFRGEL